MNQKITEKTAVGTRDIEDDGSLGSWFSEPQCLVNQWTISCPFQVSDEGFLPFNLNALGTAKKPHYVRLLPSRRSLASPFQKIIFQFPFIPKKFGSRRPCLSIRLSIHIGWHCLDLFSQE